MSGVIGKIPPKGRAVGAGIVLLGGLVLLVAGRGGPPDRGPAASAASEASAEVVESAPVQIAPVVREVASLPVEATGTVQAVLKASVSPRVMARVAQVLVREGDRVRAGQVLVRLDSADLEAAVTQAAASVESARAAVRQAQTGARIQTTQSSTRVVQARAALQAARQQLSLVMEGPRRQQKVQADLAVSEAEAAVNQARAQLSLVREGARRQQRLQTQQAVAQAQSQYETAKATYERFKALYEQEVIPRQRLDEVKAQYDAAAAQYAISKEQASLVEEGARAQEVRAAEEAVRQAEARLAMAKQQRDLAHEGGREQEVAAARAQVRQAEEALRMAEAATGENLIKRDNISLLLAQQRQAEAALRAARVQAAYATILSPFDGVVTQRLVDPGDMASPGSPLVRIEDADGFRLECAVPESRMRLIARGQRVPVALESLGWRGQGRIIEIVPAADPASRTFVVKVALQGVPGLSSGVFGKAWFAGETRTRLVVPEGALVRHGQLESVFVVGADGVARMRLVRAGEARRGMLEILSGVQEGERVVAARADRVKDGARVSPTEGAGVARP